MNLIRQIQTLRAEAARCRNLKHWKKAEGIEKRVAALLDEQFNAEKVARQMNADLDCWQDWPSEVYGDPHV